MDSVVSPFSSVKETCLLQGALKVGKLLSGAPEVDGDNFLLSHQVLPGLPAALHSELSWPVSRFTPELPGTRTLLDSFVRVLSGYWDVSALRGADAAHAQALVWHVWFGVRTTSVAYFFLGRVGMV